MVLVAGAISALILSGNMNRAQAEDAELASTAVPVQLQGWAGPGSQSCEQSWTQVEAPLNDCLYDWWLLEPGRDSVALKWESGPSGGSTLMLPDLPPQPVQSCLQRALSLSPAGVNCSSAHTLSLPPGS
jgi:hypothetical protein